MSEKSDLTTDNPWHGCDEIKTMHAALQLIGQHGDLLATHEMNGDDPPHVVFPGGVVAHAGHAGPSDRDEFAIVMASVDFTRCGRYRSHSRGRMFFRKVDRIPTRAEAKLRDAIDAAIQASDNNGGSASDAIQDMLAILVPAV